MTKFDPELLKRFERINRLYFRGNYPQARIIWSKNPLSINRYGKNSWALYANNRLFIINSCLKGKCPNYVLEYLIYHECLHFFWTYHCKGFRDYEQEYKHYHKAEAWLDTHEHMLKAGR